MFERRLKILLIVLAMPAVMVCLRLVQLQVLLAEEYREHAEQMLLRPAHVFPFLRGDITDHEGRKLAFDAPSWNICVHYGVLARDRAYLRALARKRFPDLTGEQAAAALEREIEASWAAIAECTGVTREALEARAGSVVRGVRLVKEVVSRRRGVETVVREEQMVQPIVRELDQRLGVLARERLRAYEWVEVVADQKRMYAGGPAVGHLAGRMGEVGKAQLENQPDAEGELADLARYQARERYGVQGFEAFGERWLRGRRGRVREDVYGNPVGEAIPPEDGRSLRLTIDLSLQQALYDQMHAAVSRTPFSTGGVAIVLDVPSRQVLAMVSYPSFDPNASVAERAQLARDRLHQPLSFRAVGGYYPPGSIVKPMLLAGAMADGLVNSGTRITCEQYLIRDPPRWRCAGYHGSIEPVFALQHSCNIFFYVLGERMGVERMSHWMSQFGFGRRTGTGLREEQPGILPTTPGVGASRNVSIGQGEVTVTPIQIANMIATIATGAHRPVTLWADDPSPRPSTRLPVPQEAWRLIREGMFQVINAYGGTAYQHARLTGVGDYVLLGKTGSAQAPRHVLERLYTCHFPDRVEEIPAPDRQTLARQFPEATIAGGRPYRTWPPADVDATHAWFAGYLTSRSHYLEPSNAGNLNVAIVVLIEYGEHGGAVAGPVALEMIRTVLARHGAVGAASSPRSVAGGSPLLLTQGGQPPSAGDGP
jgi:cell division protein FtsI/penicillin-binding protein 2